MKIRIISRNSMPNSNGWRSLFKEKWCFNSFSIYIVAYYTQKMKNQGRKIYAQFFHDKLLSLFPIEKNDILELFFKESSKEWRKKVEFFMIQGNCKLISSKLLYMNFKILNVIRLVKNIKCLVLIFGKHFKFSMIFQNCSNKGFWSDSSKYIFRTDLRWMNLGY